MNARTAVFPVAGLGTRLLPASKAVPKEMLPIIDKPLIQYAVEEALAAGCDHLVFVVNRHKHAIMDHFDRAAELEARLLKSGKQALLRAVTEILPEHARISFVMQSEALGLGHAVLCARHAVGDRPFAVLLPDDLMWDPERSALRQMMQIATERDASVLAVQEVSMAETGSYGIVAVAERGSRAMPVLAMVEKPAPQEAPSNLAIVGRYVLSGKIFEYLERVQPGAGGEIQLTDGIALMAKDLPVCAYRFEGERFDCGNKLGVVAATMAIALAQDDIAAAVEEKMRGLLRGLAPAAIGMQRD